MLPTIKSGWCNNYDTLVFYSLKDISPYRRVDVIINSIQGIQRNSRNMYSYGHTNRDETETKLISHQVSTLEFSDEKDEFKFTKGFIGMNEIFLY